MHEELLEATKEFKIFEEVEGEKIRPHISIGRFAEDALVIPREMQEKLDKDFELKLLFTKAYFFTPSGVKQIQLL